ncbi:MAG: hypothetical protein D6737_12875 [Chloroflexi bacterium]|nr:MAG: hypothetical protein D6737_12875 [Chloroflexota bacterium]
MSKKLLIIFSSVVLLLVFALPASVLAMPQDADALNVLFSDPGVVDSASLVRNANGLSMNIKASGLTPGNAVTVWWIIDNNPNDAIFFDGICNAAGHIVGNSGKYNAGSHLGLNEPSEDFCMSTIVEGGPALTNPLGATVILVVQEHGPHLTGQDLISQFNYPGDPLGNCNPDCIDVGDALFLAP